ncbi:MAG: hypothetical protein WC510_07345 [Candidatus Omnitrophota bacterium]
MKRLLSLFKSMLFRQWLMITAIYSMFSTCPCCGKQGCPAGLGIAAVIGLIFTSIAAFLAAIGRRLNRAFRKTGVNGG